MGVEPFNWAISLGVIGCCELVVHFEDSAYVLEEPRGYLTSVVGDQLDWRSVKDYPVIDKLLGDFCSGDTTEMYRTY